MKTLTQPMKLILAALVVAVSGGTAAIAQAQPMRGADHGPMMGERGAHAGPGMHMGERMLDRVKASAEQRAQIRQIMEAARKDMQGQREARRALRDQQMQLFTQPNVDANAVEALRQKQIAQHDQASKRMTQAMVEASRVLTPEQRAQLATDMRQRRDMMERHQRERRALDPAPKS
jgi:periplasmic protein CpxP/Spy